jgi:ribosomal protein S18 acetylase RimI-like enzyme
VEPAFRLAEHADRDLILGFMRAYYVHDHLPFDERMARNALEGFLGDPSLGRLWLILDGVEAIGYVALTLGYSLEYHGRDAFVDELFVRASHRGMGVGRAALRFAEAACRNLGVRALHLEVERANVTAQNLYRKAGFDDHDRYLMTKRLK